MELQKLKTQKAVFFTVESPPSFAGAGLNALEFAKFLSRYTLSTKLCHLNYNGVLKKYASDGDLRIERLSYYNRNILTKLISFIPLLFHYYRILRSADIIFIYSAYLIGYQFIILAGALWGKKVIFRSTLLDGDDVHSLFRKPFPLGKFNRFVFRKISLYFAINSEFSRRFKASVMKDIPVFESFQGVNMERFYPVKQKEKLRLRRKLNLPEQENIFISVGFLLRRKGYGFLFPELSKLDFNFRYIILGEYLKNSFHRTTGDEIVEMTDLVKQGKSMLGDKIIFAGTAHNIEEYIRAADIFIHGSLGEGTPNVVLEALACGLPVVIKKLPGLSRRLIHHNENAVEYKKYDELPEILENLHTNGRERERLSKAGSKTITENYTFEMVASNLIKILYA